MKRRIFFAGILVLALLCGGASVWEGNAVVGGAGDFASDGLFGACNSFPRDTSVEVSNLENGRTITVVISRNVDNPGVFIALSPKAAEALGMKPGAAARVRAVSKAISNAQATLPATRPGETSDPDYNPKALVERGKTAAPPLAPAPAPVSPSAAAIIEEAAGGEAAAPGAAALPAAAGTEAQAPATGETAAPGTEAATAEAPKPSADEAPLPAGTGASPGEPRPAPFAMSLPSPDQAPASPESPAPEAKAFPAAQPEELGGSLPQPRRTGAARVALAEPSAPAEAAAEPAGAGELEELDRPALAAGAAAPELLEPSLGPDVLPEDTLTRMVAPPPETPATALAEIDMSAVPAPAAAEAIGLDRPSEPALAGAPNALTEPGPGALAASPEASGIEKPAQTGTPPAIALAEPSTSQPEPPQSAPAPAAPGELSVALEPAAPRPPVPVAPVAGSPAAPAKPAALPETKPGLAPKDVVLVPALSKGSFYIQVGVFGSSEAIQKAAGGFASGYPLAMERVEMKTGSAYRLYVGPLSRDESGVVLYRIKSLGFKDAFLRVGT